MPTLNELIKNNKKWSHEMCEEDTYFFSRLSQQQSPDYLWIGCSDSRVPANQLVGLLPGEMFVHRNVANLVNEGDLNALSVVQYAIDQLAVKHIIVCGHYQCGGVEAVYHNKPCGLVDRWLKPIHAIKQLHHDELLAIKDDKKAINRLCELNVIKQVLNLAKTKTVEEAWSRKQPLQLHGFIYGLHNGLMNDLHIHLTSVSDTRAYQNLLVK